MIMLQSHLNPPATSAPLLIWPL